MTSQIEDLITALMMKDLRYYEKFFSGYISVSLCFIESFSKFT